MFEQPLTTTASFAEKRDILSGLLDTLRCNMTPHQGICAASDLLFEHYGCQGTLLKSATVQASETSDGTSVTFFHDPFETGALLSDFMNQAILRHLAAPKTPPEETFSFKVDDTETLICTQKLRHNEWAILVLWRKKSWHQNDKKTVTHFWKTAALLMETEDLYLTAIKKTQHDPSTGVLTWPALRQTILRRIPRLDRDGLAGTLILVQVNGMSDLTLSYGPEMEERTLNHCVAVIQHAIRPTDSVGRIGGPLFVLWLDGADRYAAAERAETMTKQGVMLPFLQPTTLSLQMGLSCREPAGFENVDDLLEQATMALKNTVPEETGRSWHFAHQTA
ncbi:GGDEF domain-containing protein [Acetobacteraceae bacterium ESL0709]|nr:GGDEF domain-containing protein [Acetobacteraceae bacterium ESL0697]MDF7677746.1 GGDEF domain-containing protein [Acetobacteraceae bacterium ESL0709]